MYLLHSVSSFLYVELNNCKFDIQNLLTVIKLLKEENDNLKELINQNYFKSNYINEVEFRNENLIKESNNNHEIMRNFKSEDLEKNVYF